MARKTPLTVVIVRSIFHFMNELEATKTLRFTFTHTEPMSAGHVRTSIKTALMEYFDGTINFLVSAERDEQEFTVTVKEIPLTELFTVRSALSQILSDADAEGQESLFDDEDDCLLDDGEDDDDEATWAEILEEDEPTSGASE